MMSRAADPVVRHASAAAALCDGGRDVTFPAEFSVCVCSISLPYGETLTHLAGSIISKGVSTKPSSPPPPSNGDCDRGGSDCSV